MAKSHLHTIKSIFQIVLHFFDQNEVAHKENNDNQIHP